MKIDIPAPITSQLEYKTGHVYRDNTSRREWLAAANGTLVDLRSGNCWCGTDRFGPSVQGDFTDMGHIDEFITG